MKFSRADDFFPEAELVDPADEQTIQMLMQFLRRRIRMRDLLREDLHQKQNNFRNVLVELERENVALKAENSSLRACNDQQRRTISSLGEKVHKLDSQIDNLLYKLNSANDDIRKMQQELRNKDKQLKQYTIDKQQIIQQCSDRIQAETERLNKEFKKILRKQRQKFEGYIKRRDDKLRLVKQILMSNCGNTLDDASLITQNSNWRTEATEERIVTTRKLSAATPLSYGSCTMTSTTSTASNITAATGETKSDAGTVENPDNPNDPIEPSKLHRRIPVVNPRYRRPWDKWINHRPARMVPLGTIFQPQTSCKRNITKLTNPKVFKSASYCLFAQEQDIDGELETKLYKANVLPTSGGGAQVVFNDIECLKQISPAKTKLCNRQVNPENNSVHSFIHRKCSINGFREF